MNQADPKEIAHHLKSLFLCCCSIMSATIETLMKAYRFKLRLEIGGNQNPGYSLFVSMAKRLGVAFEEVEVKSKPQGAPYVWLSDHTTANQRAWVPDIQNREGDFHVLCPFFFRYHLSGLRKHEPDFPSPKVDNLYILLLWAACFGSHQAPLSARIIKDLLAWEKRSILTAHSYIGPVGNEIPIVASKVASLKEMAQLYIGFWTGPEAWSLSSNNKITGHLLNQRSRKFHNILQSGVARANYPVLVRQYVWEVEQLNVVTKNVWALNKYAMPGTSFQGGKARQCLLLRLQGKTEEEVQVDLGFSSSEEYYKWQVGCFLDKAPGRLGDPLEAWLRACEYFELEPGQEVLDRVMNAGEIKREESLPSSENADKLTVTPQPIREFRAGPGYRSVVAANGKQHSLTAKQAEVIQILHEAYNRGTPDVSQGHIISEVFPNAKTNSLKKLFSDKEAWAFLVEPGKRRGLYRLKVRDSEDDSNV